MTHVPNKQSLDAAMLVVFQFGYMTRSPLRVREGFLDRLIENIRNMALKQEDQTELMACAIAAFGRGPDVRLELRNRACGMIRRWAVNLRRTEEHD